jgi:hypothetical protein
LLNERSARSKQKKVIQDTLKYSQRSVLLACSQNLYPEGDQAHKDLDTALAAGRLENKRVLDIFGANWCYDSHVRDTAVHSEQLATLVADTYHLVHIHIEDGRSNSGLAERFQVPLDKGIPGLAVINDSGTLITSQKQGEFESAAKIGIEDISSFLNPWKPPLTAASPPLSPDQRGVHRQELLLAGCARGSSILLSISGCGASRCGSAVT